MNLSFTIQRQLLLDTVQELLPLVSTRNTIPVLAHILVLAESRTVALAANNLDLGARRFIDANVEPIGAATIPAVRLLAILRQLEDDVLRLTCDESLTWEIESSAARFQLKGLPAEEFPPLKTLDADTPIVTLRQDDLRKTLRQVQHAISTDETRYALNGVKFEYSDHKLTLVASDGRRLAYTEIELELPHEVSAIVPTAAVRQLIATLGNAGDVGVQIATQAAVFRYGNIKLATHLVECNYPDWRKVLPGERRARTTLDREALLRALKRVAIAFVDEIRHTRFMMRAKKGALVLSVENSEHVDASEALSALHDGPDQEMLLNPVMLSAALEGLAGYETVFLDWADPDPPRPVTLKVRGPFLYLQMPIIRSW